MFKDPDWDGDQYCPECGNWPCTCMKKKPNEFHDSPQIVSEPLVCPVCGNLPCTCDRPQTNLIDIKLSDGRRLSLETTWEQKIFFGDEFISQLLRTLDEAGFAEDKLNLLRNMLKLQKCDLLDVLEFIAYNSTPIERVKRVEIVKKQYVDALNKEQREFDNLILEYYASNGFKELGSDKLKTFINIKFNSMRDAKERLNMSVADIREHYFELQRRLYRA